jgi:hypothetical protein
MESIRLQDAYLCPDCHCVINCATHCACGNAYGLQCLSTVLNRELEDKELVASSPWPLYGLAKAIGQLESVLASE